MSQLIATMFLVFFAIAVGCQTAAQRTTPPRLALPRPLFWEVMRRSSRKGVHP